MEEVSKAGGGQNPGAPTPQVDEAERVERALLDRPKISIRSRIVGSFLFMFALMAGITVAAVLVISQFRDKVAFLDKVNLYAIEVQQARRYEKNYFLYGTNLDDALENVENAQRHLLRSREDIERVAGRARYRSMQRSLERYASALERLRTVRGRLARSPRAWPAGEPRRPRARSRGSPETRELERSIRRWGSRAVEDVQELFERERTAMHAMLHTFRVAAVGSLIIMFLVMIIIAGFLIRAVLRPLARFRRYTERIAAGDTHLILPARPYRDEFSSLAVAINKMLHELDLRQAQLLQSGKMAAIGTLTSGVAHELNNPLNNIGLTTEALLDGLEDYSQEDVRHMLDQIYTQVERASATVRNLLDFTRKDKPVLTRVELGKLLADSTKLVRHEMDLADIRLENEVPADLPTVRGNPRNLQQVFVNLMLNAVQAMSRGGTLRLRAACEDAGVRVDVADTGPGIPKADMEKIFEPFFTTKDPGEGTGLGLAVSYGIVEKHGGRISVQSEVGRGTTFSVWLPLEQRPGSDSARSAR